MIRLLNVLVLTVAIMLGICLGLHRRAARAGTLTAEAEPPKPVVPEPLPRWDVRYVSYRVSLLRDSWTGREFLVSDDGGFIEVGPKR